MAPTSHSMIGWSWWPVGWLTYALLVSLIILLVLDFVFLGLISHQTSLSAFIAIVLAAPYVVLFIIGYPSHEPYDHLRHGKPAPRAKS